MIVVSDTSPLHYLILIEAEHLLPTLYDRVIIPTEVLRELQAENTPEKLRAWTESPPPWLDVQTAPPHSVPDQIHPGEAAAVALAKHLRADLLLMDDREAKKYAEKQGLRVTGVLGVLRDAAEQQLVDLEASFKRLHEETNFRAPQKLLDEVLDDFRRKQSLSHENEAHSQKPTKPGPERDFER